MQYYSIINSFDEEWKRIVRNDMEIGEPKTMLT